MQILIATPAEPQATRLRDVLARLPGVDAAAYVTSLPQARARLEAGDTDMLVIDGQLLDWEANGLTELLRASPDVVAFVLGGDDPDLLRQSLSEGAAAYLLRGEAEASIGDAMVVAFSGGVFIPPIQGIRPAGEKLMTSAGPVPAGFFRENALEHLTPRQTEVLSMIRADWSNQDIADVLGVSVGTVKIHITAIFKALGVRNRTQARIAAERLNLPEPVRPR